MAIVKTDHLCWMYDVNTKDGVLFQPGTDYNDEQWMDTPAKCGIITDAEVLSDEEKEALKEIIEERSNLKEEAFTLGLEFPSNVKTEKLKQMIEDAKKVAL